MEKEFIPYEEALALKELGFDEPCFAFFTPERILIIARGDCLQSITENAPITPLYQQAFKWFREKYKLRSTVIPHWLSENEFMVVIEGEVNFDEAHKIIQYHSHEEAELECLKKLIEIVKNK